MKLWEWSAMGAIALVVACHGGYGTIDAWMKGPQKPPSIEDYRQHMQKRSLELYRLTKENRQTTQAIAASLLRDARLALLKKDNETAKRLADTVIQVDKNNAAAHQIRGVAAYNLGLPEEALVALTTSIRLKGDVATSYMQRAAVYIASGGYEKAIGDLNKVIELNPDISEAYMARGKCKQWLKRWQEAETDYEIALKKAPDSPRVYRQLASLYRERGDSARAAEFEAKAENSKTAERPKP